jgi:hypothetical protein
MAKILQMQETAPNPAGRGSYDAESHKEALLNKGNFKQDWYPAS